MREKTRAHGCDHVLFPFPHPQDRPGVPHVAAAAGQIPHSWPAPSANFASAHSSNVILQTSMTVVSRLSAARSAGLARTGSGGRSRGRDRGRPRLPRPLDHLTEPRAPLSYTPWDTLTGVCIWCFPLRDDRFLRVRRRAGMWFRKQQYPCQPGCLAPKRRRKAISIPSPQYLHIPLSAGGRGVPAHRGRGDWPQPPPRAQRRAGPGPVLGRRETELDFTHFKRHKRGNLQVDGIERPGVPEYLGQLQTVKNLPAPAAGAAAPERWHPLLLLDFA